MNPASDGLSLTRSDNVFTINFGDGDNMTTVAWIDEINVMLDEIEAAEGPKALITTGGGKHYSNGLDVAHMTADPEGAGEYVSRVEGVLGRLLTFPAPTIAAVNGHAFGAGAFVVAVHDQAVMRDDRGFVCWPEVLLGMPFTRGLMSIVRDMLSTRTAHEAVVTGRRYGGADAVEAGFVDATASLDDLMATAASMVEPLATTAGPNLAGIKKSLHFETWSALVGSD